MITKENLGALKCVIHMAQYCYQKTVETPYSNVDEIIAKYQEKQLEIAVKMYNEMAEELERAENGRMTIPKEPTYKVWGR